MPAYEYLIIDSAKMRNYLLSLNHPHGRAKAKWFAGIGYTSSNWRDLDMALREHAGKNAWKMVEQSVYGDKY